jgi:hypothetical protein
MKLLVLGLAFACWHAAAQQRYPDPPWMVGPAPAVLAPTVSFPVRLVETPGLLPRFEIVDGVCVIYLSARNDAEVFLASPILDYCGSFRGLATRPVPGTLWVRWKQAASIVEVTRLFDETSPPRKVNPKRPFVMGFYWRGVDADAGTIVSVPGHHTGAHELLHLWRGAYHLDDQTWLPWPIPAAGAN